LEIVRTGIEVRGWKDIRAKYYGDLRQACNKAGEQYTGSHRFRASYASERFQSLEKTVGYQQAERLLTQELGHNRSEMSHYYRF
jgi:hypothetical protein